MKELSVEQKARAYDEALEKAKEFKNNPFAGYDGTDLISALFPELAESEDERIRKEMLQIAKESEDSFYMVMTPSKRERLIAWLEKQSDTQKKIDHAYAKGLSDAKKALEKQSEQKPTKEYNITGIKSKHAQGKLGEMIKRKLEIEKQAEQNHTWSEEDIMRIDNLVAIIENRGYPDYVDYLKKLKNRILPQPNQEEWSEENIAIISRVISIVKWAAYSDHSHPILNDEGATELIDWLKSLRPQNNNKWNNVSVTPKFPCNILFRYPNGNMFIFRYLEGGKKNDATTPMFSSLEAGEWIYLDDVKPQNRWKPSDEQITWLYRAADDASKDSRMKQVLENLLSDLKKLREE